MSMELFAALSGLKPNSLKSEVFVARINGAIATELCDILDMQLGTLPVRYFGVPLVNTRLTYSNCINVIEKIQNKSRAGAPDSFHMEVDYNLFNLFCYGVSFVEGEESQNFLHQDGRAKVILKLIQPEIKLYVSH
ncbi:hypothetical protein ACH5RR_003729 [Cinchona calisaya]|uniref:Uncharacterized protein n=1 Tax=Cinchona calisaya TaxID=153742 RepID=A0ABD3AVL7_9GENT